tara:strand:+ start:198 stop:518 length:321 start_codon:yes stop_codon:yes gene_type:complete
MKKYKFLLDSEIPECSKVCIKHSVSCPNEGCRNWIDYEDDYNCTSIAVENNGSMTLREVAERLGVSFVRIKQIEDKVLQKLESGLAKEFGVKKADLKDFVLTGFSE